MNDKRARANNQLGFVSGARSEIGTCARVIILYSCTASHRIASQWAGFAQCRVAKGREEAVSCTYLYVYTVKMHFHMRIYRTSKYRHTKDTPTLCHLGRPLGIHRLSRRIHRRNLVLIRFSCLDDYGGARSQSLRSADGGRQQSEVSRLSHESCCWVGFGPLTGDIERRRRAGMPP